MKTLWSVICVLFLAGCQSLHYETDKGYISSKLTINRWGKQPLEALIGSAHLVTEDKLWGPFNYDFGAGPIVVVPTDGKATALGFDIASKIILNTQTIQPYVEVGVGFLDATERWDGQGTDWGFILQGGLGIRYVWSESTKIGLAYKHWHESNGASIFGSPQPNPGFESGSLWFSYTFDF